MTANLTKYSLATARFPSGAKHSGRIVGLPGERYDIDGCNGVLPAGHYRFRYYSRGLAYLATIPADRLTPLDHPNTREDVSEDNDA